jgi:hypothetical protein
MPSSFELSSASTAGADARPIGSCPAGTVDQLSRARDGLADRLWRWEFLVIGRPSREMAGDGGLFAQAIARGAELLEVEGG